MNNQEVRNLKFADRKNLAKDICLEIATIGTVRQLSNGREYTIKTYYHDITVSFFNDEKKIFVKNNRSIDWYTLNIDTLEATYRCYGTKSSEDSAEVLIIALESIEYWKRNNVKEDDK